MSADDELLTEQECDIRIRKSMVNRLRKTRECLSEAAELWVLEIQALTWAINEIDPQLDLVESKRENLRQIASQSKATFKQREGGAPWGKLSPLIMDIIQTMEGEFTLPQVLAKVRETYPATPRNRLHLYFARFVEKGIIVVVTPGRQGSTAKPTVYRRADEPSVDDVAHKREMGVEP